MKPERADLLKLKLNSTLDKARRLSAMRLLSLWNRSKQN